MLGVLLALGYTAILLFLIRRWSFFAVPALSKGMLGGIFLVKIAAGTVLWYIYTYHYTDRATADIYKYFDDGNVMFSALHRSPLDYLSMLTGIGNDEPRFDKAYYLVMNNWYRAFESNLFNDSHTIIRFNALVRVFSFGYFHVHTVFACFFGLVGGLAFYKAVAPFIPGTERVFALGLFLLPSVLFWGSSVIKETLLFFGLGLFLFQYFRLLEKRIDRMGVVILLFSLVLLFFLKFYVLLSLLPALVAYTWCRLTGQRRAALKFLLTYAAFIVLALNSDRLIPRFNILDVLYVKQRDFIGMAVYTKANSLVAVTPLQRDVWSFVRTAPEALGMTFLSPFLMWNKGALGLISAVENLLLLAMVIPALRYMKGWKRIDRPLLLFCMGYCLLIGLVIGWTTPVIGALVRYRVPMLPFLVLACLLLIDPQRIRLPRWLVTPRST